MRRIALILGLVLGGCGVPCSQVQATRCSGDVVQICGSNRQWQRVLDCGQARSIRGGPARWTCGSKDGRSTCVPGGGR